MSIKISLWELADLSIGSPEAGVVNFNALHTLLRAMIKHLKLEDMQTDLKEEGRPPPKPGEPLSRVSLEKVRDAEDFREKERKEQDKRERDRERERERRERAERAERDKAERDKAERDKPERERAERDRAEKDKPERDKPERDKAERERAEKVPGEKEKREKEKVEKGAKEKVEKVEKGAKERAEKGEKEKAEKGEMEKPEKEKEKKEKKVWSEDDEEDRSSPQLSDLEKRIDDLESNMRGVEDNITDVEDQVRDVKFQVRRVKDQVHGVQDHLQAVENKMDGMDKKVDVFEKQVSVLERLPSGTDLLEKSRSGTGAVADMWQMMQMQKKMEANEEGINQAMALLQDLVDEANALKASTIDLQEEMQKLKEHVAQIDPHTLDDKLKTCISEQMILDQDVKELEQKLSRYPSPEEMDNMVRWEVLEDVLVKGKRSSSEISPTGSSSPQERRTPGSPGTQPSVSRGTSGTQSGVSGAQAGAPGAQRGAQAPAGFPGAQPAGQPGAAAPDAGYPGGGPGARPAAAQPGAQPGYSGAPGVQPGYSVAQPGAPGAKGPYPGAPGAQGPYPGAPWAQGPYPGAPGAQGPYPGAPGAQGPYPGAPGAQGPYPGVPRAQGPYPGAPGAQGPYPGAPGAQGPYPGAPWAQGPYPGAPGAQGPYPGAPGAQGPYPGAPGAQGPYPGVPGAQGPYPGVPGAQGPYPGAPGAQGPYPGAPGAQGPYPGAPGAQGPYPGVPGAQGPSAGAPRAQGPSAGAPRAQAPSAGAPRAQGPSAGAPGAQGPYPGAPGAQAAYPGVPGPQGPYPGVSGAQPGVSGAQPGVSGAQPGAQPGAPSVQPSISGASVFQAEITGGFIPDGQTGYPEVQPWVPWPLPPEYQYVPSASQLTMPPGSQLSVPSGIVGATPPTSPLLTPTTPLQDSDLAGSTLAPARYAETVDALRQLAMLTDFCNTLKDQITLLDHYKCNHSDLGRLQDFLTDAIYRSLAIIPPDLPEKLAAMKSMEEDLKAEKDKINKLQKAIEGDLAEDSLQRLEGAGQINRQIGYLRATVRDIESELKELREKQEKGKATLEQSLNDNAYCLQEQLDKLRSVIENMMTSSSALLSMSMPPTPEPGLAEVHTTGTCAACSLDVSEKVSQLFKRYEHLQDMFNTFMLRHSDERMTRKPRLQQDEEMLSNIQNTILQVQEDCEKLNTTTGNLLDDHRKKQQEISTLFKSLEKLESEKADKERVVVEVGGKADKSALAAKVSRTQFDATTQQLHKMMQELLNKMAGQEQDWQKMLDKLLIEMDSKLDRLELDPFREQLEERWKDIRKQLKEKPPPQDMGDDAAGLRRRLLAHFHCISCDRPLEVVLPGPQISTLPAVPALPPHPSLRPYMVYEMEQMRQLSRSLKLGPGFRFDALEKSASLNKLRRIHSKMLMDIQKVQRHYGNAAKVNAQMIRELLQSQCIGSSPLSKREKLPDTADCTYLSVPRHCGGSHTLTYPYRRYGRLQQFPQFMTPDENSMVAMMRHEEVDILGLDGHIYKGRMETQLPSITEKDGSRSRNKVIRSSSQRHQPSVTELPNLPARPHTARVSTRSTSAKSVGDRSVVSQPHLRSIEEPQMLDRETLEVRMDIPTRHHTDEQSA